MTEKEKKEILKLLKEVDGMLDTIIPEEELDCIYANMKKVQSMIKKIGTTS